METTGRTSHVLFASGMIGMGLVGLYFGDFASVAQEFPKWVPGRSVILYAAAALMVVGGIGLLFRRSAALSARVLFFYTALWALLLNVPIVVKAPLIEVNYQGLGEIMVILAGAWVLFAAAFPAPRAGAPMSFAFGNRGTRFAQIVFGLAALPLGLAHFFYLANTAPLVPSWLPYHTAWAYLTGAAQIVAGFAVLISVVPRLAAMLDAVLLTLFTFLVWPPLMIGKPPSSDMWSEITVSWAISAAAFVVAASIRAKKTTTVV